MGEALGGTSPHPLLPDKSLDGQWQYHEGEEHPPARCHRSIENKKATSCFKLGSAARRTRRHRRRKIQHITECSCSSAEQIRRRYGYAHPYFEPAFGCRST